MCADYVTGLSGCNRKSITANSSCLKMYINNVSFRLVQGQVFTLSASTVMRAGRFGTKETDESSSLLE